MAKPFPIPAKGEFYVLSRNEIENSRNITVYFHTQEEADDYANGLSLMGNLYISKRRWDPKQGGYLRYN